MNLKEIIVVSLENYAENMRLTVPFLVPTIFITAFIYLTNLDLGLAIELKALLNLDNLLSMLQNVNLNIEMKIFISYFSIYLLLLIFGAGIDIGFLKKEIEEETSLEKGIKESYKSFLALILLSVFYFLLVYLMFSVLPRTYFYGGIFILTFFFLYTFPSIILDNNNFIPAIFRSVQRIVESPIKSIFIYILSLFFLFLSLISLFYELIYFPIILMFILPLIINFITLSYLQEEKEGEKCPECGGILEEYDGMFICTQCGAEYVYE